VEDQEDEVGKVEHVRQVEHLKVTAHPEHGKMCGIALEIEGINNQKHMKGLLKF
jgi:hypothetical protein